MRGAFGQHSHTLPSRFSGTWEGVIADVLIFDQTVENQMSDAITDVVVENYKGILQEYCHVRNLENPAYETVQHGSPNKPSWNVTIRYGQSSYVTPDLVFGSKRVAEQTATKQLLELIEVRQEAFLAGKPLDQLAESTAPKTQTDAQSEETLKIPIELLTTVLGIANHRLAMPQGNIRSRDSSESKKSNQVFAENLANLTMTIVREVTKAAETANIQCVSLKKGKSSSDDIHEKDSEEVKEDRFSCPST